MNQTLVILTLLIFSLQALAGASFGDCHLKELTSFDDRISYYGDSVSYVTGEGRSFTMQQKSDQKYSVVIFPNTDQESLVHVIFINAERTQALVNLDGHEIVVSCEPGN